MTEIVLSCCGNATETMIVTMARMKGTAVSTVLSQSMSSNVIIIQYMDYYMEIQESAKYEVLFTIIHNCTIAICSYAFADMP